MLKTKETATKGNGFSHIVSKKTCFSQREVFFEKLLNTLLAQARAGRSALTSLELGVAFANNIEGSFALDHLAVGVASLHGGK